MTSPAPLQEQAPAGLDIKSMVIGTVGVVGAELIASVQLSCLIFEDYWGWEKLGLWAWFGLLVPGILLYCASHLRLFGRGIVGPIAGVLTSIVGLATLITSSYFDWEGDDMDQLKRERLWISGHFFTTLAVGITHTTSRSFLIATTPPENQGLVHAAASIGASVFSAIHIFVVSGAVLQKWEVGLQERFRNCEIAFSVIGFVMTCGSFGDLRTITNAPLALTLDRGGDDEPLWKLVKPFMFAISGYFGLQVVAVRPFLEMIYRIEYEGENWAGMPYRGVGVFQVGALVGSAPFILKLFQGKGGLIVVQVVAVVFITAIVLTDSLDSLTAVYAFCGLGLGALRAEMFAFLGQTVTPDNTAESVGIFVSFSLIAQAIAHGVLRCRPNSDDYFDGLGNLGLDTMFCAVVIVIGLVMTLRLPNSVGRANDQP